MSTTIGYANTEHAAAVFLRLPNGRRFEEIHDGASVHYCEATNSDWADAIAELLEDRQDAVLAATIGYLIGRLPSHREQPELAL